MTLRRMASWTVAPCMALVCACARPAPGIFSEPALLPSPAGAASGEPSLAVSPDGAVYLSWFEERGDGHALRVARLQDDAWGEAGTIAEGDSFFVNWADFPTVLALGDGRLAAHYPWMNGEGTFAYDVVIRFSEDDGASWGPPIRPHTDGTATEHGFVSMLPAEDGLRAVWLDGRKGAGLSAAQGDDHGHGGEMTLRSARVAPDGKLSEEVLLDDRVCECCQTSAVTTEQGVLVSYRDRSSDEVRDIHTVRLEASGWSEPHPLHVDGWRIPGCPVNGAALDAGGDVVVAAWYTAVADSPIVRSMFSADAGRTFGPPVHVDDGLPLGRLDTVLLEDGSAVVSWLETVEDGAAVRLRHVAPEKRGEALTLDHVSASRASGVPRLARSGDSLIAAWTQVGAAVEGGRPPTNIRVARIRLR